MSAEALLFGHLAGAFLFVSGAVMAAAARVSALRRSEPGDIALALRGARQAVPLIGIGLVVTVVFGVRLADRSGLDLGSTWLTATYVLLGWIVVVGAVAGRQDRRTRELAERLAAADAGPSAELARRLRSPVSLVLDGSLVVVTVTIIALMVWKP